MKKSVVLFMLMAITSPFAVANSITEVVCEAQFRLYGETRDSTFQVLRNPEVGSQRQLIFREGESRNYKAGTGMS